MRGGHCVVEIQVSHPEDWIGVPEQWPNEGWPTPDKWAVALVEELVGGWGPPSGDQSEVMRVLLVDLALMAEKRGSRACCSIDGWSGSLTIAFLAAFTLQGMDGTTVEELAADQADAVEKPIVEGFVSDSGLVRWATTRYSQGSESPGLVARLDYLWPTPGGCLWLSTANSDLVAFERSRLLVAELARTVAVIP